MGAWSPPLAIDQPYTTERHWFLLASGSNRQRPSSPAAVRRLALQMLVDMKEQMKEQQAQSDRDREQAALGRENAICEQEALRQLKEQPQAQIAALRTPRHRHSRKASLELENLPISGPSTN